MICASFNPPEKAYDTFPAAVIHQYVETFEPSLRRLRSPLKLRENLRAIRQIAGIAGSESLDRNAKRNACQGIVESWQKAVVRGRSEEHTSELQSLMRISYAVFCLKKQN